MRSPCYECSAQERGACWATCARLAEYQERYDQANPLEEARRARVGERWLLMAVLRPERAQSMGTRLRALEQGEGAHVEPETPQRPEASFCFHEARRVAMVDQALAILPGLRAGMAELAPVLLWASTTPRPRPDLAAVARQARDVARTEPGAGPPTHQRAGVAKPPPFF